MYLGFHRRGHGARHGWLAMRGGFRGHHDHWAERGFGGREGGRRRLFDGGELRLVLLRLIADEPRHGYDLIRAIEARTCGAYAPSPGVVYPTLTLLGDMAEIAEQPGEGARRVFAATDAGRAALAEKAELVDELMRRLDAIGAMRARTDGGSLRRALHNLRAVLRDRFADEEVDRAIIDQAVAMIDETARRIERL